MRKFKTWALCCTVAAFLILAYWLFRVPPVAGLAIPTAPEAIAEGEYLVAAGGCVSCHEGVADSSSLSGGLALESEFGSFYAPNITPHVESGIGGWDAENFLLAMKHGRSPEGNFYFPAFPYRAYAGLTDEDVLKIAAYLQSLPPVDSSVPPHDVPAWLFRWTLAGWNRIADLVQPALDTPSDPVLRRGAYLARNLGHCGECHTPRNVLGIPDLAQEFAGATLGDGHVEALNREALSGWTADDFAFLLFLGMKPDGEYVGGEMESVIEHNTSRLTEEDREALAAFFMR